MGGDVAAGDIVPLAIQDVSALDRTRNHAWRCATRTAELAVGAIHVDLRLFREKCRQHDRVTGGQSEHPTARRATSGYFHHHPRKRSEIEFIAAEPTRLEDAVEAGRDKLVVGLRRNATQRFT